MSKKLQNLQEAETYLLSYSPEKQTGATYTLGRMRLLMDHLGNPQDDVRSIHVAGTSGKTSTSYYIRSLLEAYGQKTGLTASPHVVSITERVQVAGQPLHADDFLRYLNEFLALVEQWDDVEPSYFELLVAFAFWVFKNERVDYMVIEVGLGGLLDATNVISRMDKVSVITPIGLDHTTVLGNTVAEIATQKAGVILNDSSVFSAEQDESAQVILDAVIEATRSQLATIHPDMDNTIAIPLFQQANFALARAVVSHIAERDSLKKADEQILSACIMDSPPGRFETYKIGDKTLILDGAHNPQKLSAFVASLRLKHTEPISWLLGFIEAPDSKIDACLKEVQDASDDYSFTDFSVGQDIKNRKSVSAELLSRAMSENGFESLAELDPFHALELLLDSKKRTIVVSGSLYLVALLRPRIIELAT